MAISKPVLYGLIGVIGVAAWFLTEPEPVAPGGAKPKAASAKDKTKGVVYTEQDYKARFASLEGGPRNVFKPLVERSTGPSSELLSPNSIPSDFTGGDPNWIFTGMATVDGVAMGLVENSASGDGEFLKISQRWKKARVLRITPEALVMESDRGVVRTMTLKAYDEVPPPVIDVGSVEPVNPLQGPIGDGNGNGNGIGNGIGIGNGNGNGVAIRPQATRPQTSNGTPTETSDEN